jgi:hypothetical protein
MWSVQHDRSKVKGANLHLVVLFVGKFGVGGGFVGYETVGSETDLDALCSGCVVTVQTVLNSSSGHRASNVCLAWA